MVLVLKLFARGTEPRILIAGPGIGAGSMSSITTHTACDGSLVTSQMASALSSM